MDTGDSLIDEVSETSTQVSASCLMHRKGMCVSRTPAHHQSCGDFPHPNLMRNQDTSIDSRAPFSLMYWYTCEETMVGAALSVEEAMLMCVPISREFNLRRVMSDVGR